MPGLLAAIDTSFLPPGVAALAALASGFAIAALARLLVPRVRSISWPTSAILAVVGGVVGVAIANAVLADPVWLSILLSLVLTIGLLLVGTAVEARLHPEVGVHATPTAELLRLGESESVEFKSTARRNLHTRERDPAIEAVIAKTVCGLLNGRGGTLLIGVDDAGTVVGLGDDMALMKRPDTDAYELFLRDLLTSSLGVAATAGVSVRFERPAEVDSGRGAGEVAAGEVCRVDVAPSPAPVYLTPPKGKGRTAGDPEFWVRAGNGTRQLRIDELLDYHRRRWGGWLSR